MTTTFAITQPNQRNVIAIAFTFTILAVIACCLRALARRVAGRRLDSSDWFIFAACVVTVAYQSLNISSVYTCGVGLHFADIMKTHGLAPITRFLKILVAVQVLWATSLSLCKISILILYARIFTMPAFIWVARITTGVIIMWALATILMGFFMCRPFEFNWNQSLPGGHCGNQVLSYQITGALNLVTDLVVLVLPLHYVYNLNLALYKKVILMVSLAVGLFTCIVSILRIIALSSVDYSDVTFNVPESLIFSGLEPCLAVTLGCVPVLQPLLKMGSSRATSALSSGKNNSRKSDFNQLNDNSSEYQLRPVGPKHTVGVRAQHSSGSGLSSDGDERSDNKAGVVVKQEWRVAATEV